MVLAEAPYDFELERVAAFVGDADVVALQLPEGLMRYAAALAAELRARTGAAPVILGDVAYGACNLDDFAAARLGARRYVHFGHSQLVRARPGGPACMYVPCRLRLRLGAQLGLLERHVAARGFARVQLAATAQTRELACEVAAHLAAARPGLVAPAFKMGGLHANELLGCTCRRFAGADAVYSLADGLFHAEAVRVANPGVPVFRVDLRSGEIAEVGADGAVEAHRAQRAEVIRGVAARLAAGRGAGARVGVVFGTLGRQSSPASLAALERFLRERMPGASWLVQPLQEIYPRALLEADLVVQLSCPRLTFDWGSEFPDNVVGLWEFYRALEGGGDYKLVHFGGDVEEAGAYLDAHGGCVKE